MTQNITLEDWEAKQMRDPEFRAAVEELESEYQRERRHVKQTEQKARIIGAETRNEMNAKAIYDLQQEVMEQAKRIEKLEARTTINIEFIDNLQSTNAVLNERIKELETCTAINAETVEHVTELRRVVAGQGERITELEQRIERLEVATGSIVAIETIKALGRRVERLEAALRDVACCLIDGKVDIAMPIPNELHGHRILGTKSARTMVEVYHRLKE